MEFVLNTRDNSSASQYVASSQRSSPPASLPSTLSSLPHRSFPPELSPSYFPRFPFRPPCRHSRIAPSHRPLPHLFPTVSLPSTLSSFPYRSSHRSSRQAISHGFLSYLHGFLSVQHAVSFPPSETLRKLFARFPVRPALSRSVPAKLSESYLHGFLSVQHAVSLPPSEALPKLFPRFPIRPACCLAPSQRSCPQAICTVSSPSSMLSRSLPCSEALPKLFARFPVRPACCLAPSQRSSPQAICTVSSPSSMLSRSLPCSEALPKLFARFPVRPACCLAPSHEALPKLFAWFPLRPACCLASAQRSSPQAISTVSSPSRMLSRFLPTKLGFVSVQHAVSLPLSEACCLAPSQRSSPQAICTVSSPSSMLSRSLLVKLSPSYLHGFLSVQHAVSLRTSEALRKLFPRFPLRPACCLPPSRRSFPQPISLVFALSSMQSRSLLAKLSPSYLHGFFSVQHAVSLPPSKALRNLIPRFHVRPACSLAISERSFPQAISTVSSPSSMLSCSVPAKLSPSYFHRCLSVQRAVSLPPSETF